MIILSLVNVLSISQEYNIFLNKPFLLSLLRPDLYTFIVKCRFQMNYRLYIFFWGGGGVILGQVTYSLLSYQRGMKKIVFYFKFYSSKCLIKQHIKRNAKKLNTLRRPSFPTCKKKRFPFPQNTLECNQSFNKSMKTICVSVKVEYQKGSHENDK